MNLRIGQGFDVHALVTGRDLIIGGVTIPHTHGLEGHSDADVLLHALTDACSDTRSPPDVANVPGRESRTGQTCRGGSAR